MTTLDDFFGDGRTAEKVCLYCGSQDGELIVAVSDAYGPTHWKHEACQIAEDARREAELAEEKKRIAYMEWIAETDN